MLISNSNIAIQSLSNVKSNIESKAHLKINQSHGISTNSQCTYSKYLIY